jgi:hypothetical protein
VSESPAKAKYAWIPPENIAHCSLVESMLSINAMVLPRLSIRTLYTHKHSLNIAQKPKQESHRKPRAYTTATGGVLPKPVSVSVHRYRQPWRHIEIKLHMYRKTTTLKYIDCARIYVCVCRVSIPIAYRHQSEANEYKGNPKDQDHHEDHRVGLGRVHELLCSARGCGSCCVK